MNVKKIAAAGIAAACLVSVAACGGNGGNDASENNKAGITYPEIKRGETDKDLKAEITFFNGRTDMGLATYPGKNWESYMKDFNAMYPNIKVKIQADSNYADSALTRLQANNDSWDVMMITAVDRSEFANYFVSYGKTEDMGKEIKLANEKAYERHRDRRPDLGHRLQREGLQGSGHQGTAEDPGGVPGRPQARQGEDEGDSAVHELRRGLGDGRMGCLHRRQRNGRSEVHEPGHAA